MPAYKTPDVYVEEIPTLPPSVAEVSTAIPAFLGYTEIGPVADNNNKVQPVVRRISSLLEFEEAFGGPARGAAFKLTTEVVDAAKGLLGIATVERTVTGPDFSLYYAVSLYFKNGGGACYIVSVGNYKVGVTARGHFEAGLAALKKEDEPTLIVLADAAGTLSSADDYYDLCGQALAQCKELGDRFTLLDVVGGDVARLRNKVSSDLAYGAAYHPYLQTTLAYAYDEQKVTVTTPPSDNARSWTTTLGTDLKVTFTGTGAAAPKVISRAGGKAADVAFTVAAGPALTIDNVQGAKVSDVVSAWTEWKKTNNSNGFDLATVSSGQAAVPATADAGQVLVDASVGTSKTLAQLRSENTSLYNQARAELASQQVVLPPSAAVAGIYARVDRERGVWKAPANVGVAGIIGPVTKISAAEQEDLNVDVNGGKSVNAIRAFAGKGTLVWGARTLAGNDNEWRYVPVRRLFIMIEESARKASAFAVFEPNDATTWLKVKAMIESFLFGLWERGAFAGSKPEDAYFVHVGLGTTMTAQDVLEGRMFVQIGVAAVRPAEFIILRFMHKLQQA